MSSRKSTGKRLRFEVFKRDLFTCQYCGAQPPDVLLVIDHIEPVAAGGPETIDNLITACEACNQGKAAKPLTARIVRPDADLLYLETQQEIAELKRFQTAVQAREEEMARTIEVIQKAWYAACSEGLDWHPADHIVRRFINKHGPEIAYQALVDVAPKVYEGYIRKNWVPYAWAVARNLAAQQGQELDEVDPDSTQIHRLPDANDKGGPS